MRLVLVVVAALAAPTFAAAEELSLLCKGTVSDTETTTAWVQGKTTRFTREFTRPGQYRVRIKDGIGELTGARRGTPLPIKDLVVGEREITGKVTEPAIISQTYELVIDRRTGDMRYWVFRGNCEKGPAEDAPNKF